MRKNEMAIKIGNRVKSIREAKHLSQSDLAARLGIDRSTLARYELGSRMTNIMVLWDIADCLEVSLDELTCRTDFKDDQEIGQEENPTL